jgi:hypothetical protein
MANQQKPILAWVGTSNGLLWKSTLLLGKAEGQGEMGMRMEYPATPKQKELLKVLDPNLRTDKMTSYEAMFMIRRLGERNSKQNRMDIITRLNLKVKDKVTEDDGKTILTIKIISPTGYVTFEEKKRHWNPINLKRV